MIYKKPDEKFSHENITYTVGSRVLANEASEYSGLFGRILEIRTDDDRETENDTPDIYCEFDPPCLSAARRALEQTFSELYGAPKRVEDLGLELVIMAPEMLTPLAVPEQAYPQGTLYVVVSHWATDGEFGSYEAPFTNLMDAQRQFHDDLKTNWRAAALRNGVKRVSLQRKKPQKAMSAIWMGNTAKTTFTSPLKNGLCRWLLNLYAPWRQPMKMSAHGRIFLIKLKLCRSIWL